MKNRSKACVTAVALLIAVVVYRLSVGMAGAHGAFIANFSPLAAIALCGGVYLPKRLALPLPLAALFLSDLVLNAHYHAPLVDAQMLPRCVALGLVVALGFALRGRARLFPLLTASAAGSALFYMITNTASWLGEPAYAKTLAGWTQALTTGLPGYPPTWMFFRNSLGSDLMFTLLFAICMALTARREQTAEAGFTRLPVTR